MSLSETYRETLILRLVEGITSRNCGSHRYDARLGSRQFASRDGATPSKAEPGPARDQNWRSAFMDARRTQRKRAVAKERRLWSRWRTR